MEKSIPKINYCPSCGTRISQEKSYCTNCGRTIYENDNKNTKKSFSELREEREIRLNLKSKDTNDNETRFCSTCGNYLGLKPKFCSECGMRISYIYRTKIDDQKFNSGINQKSKKAFLILSIPFLTIFISIILYNIFGNSPQGYDRIKKQDEKEPISFKNNLPDLEKPEKPIIENQINNPEENKIGIVRKILGDYYSWCSATSYSPSIYFRFSILEDRIELFSISDVDYYKGIDEHLLEYATGEILSIQFNNISGIIKSTLIYSDGYKENRTIQILNREKLYFIFDDFCGKNNAYFSKDNSEYFPFWIKKRM